MGSEPASEIERDPAILVLAPTGRDAELVCEVIRGQGLACDSCESFTDLVPRIEGGGGPVVLTEEALTPASAERLRQVLDSQPSWSDLPLILLASIASRPDRLRTLSNRRNTILLQRPLPVAAFLSTVRSALESRRRQYELRDLLADMQDLNASLERRASQLQRLTLALAETEHRERRQLSRVLHDHLQQLLVGAKYHVHILRNRVPVEAHSSIETVEGLLDESVDVSRSLAIELSPPVLRESSLRDALNWLARRMEQEQGLRIAMRVPVDPPPVGERFKLLLFDAARELLFNVAKHAGVKAAEITLAGSPRGGLAMIVEDRGRGLDPGAALDSASQTEGMGLFHLRERIEYLGASFRVHSRPGDGCRVEVSIPARVLDGAEGSLARQPDGPEGPERSPTG